VNNDKTYRRPESVLVVIYNHSYQLLLLERHNPKLYWQSVTGSLSWNESPIEAARREVLEETNINEGEWDSTGESRVYAIHPAWKDKFEPDTESNLEHWFYLRVNNPIVRNNGLEHKKIEWFSIDNAIQTVSSETNREAIIALKSNFLRGS
jgi:dihydroneopterin triphosphate diphosphatase